MSNSSLFDIINGHKYKKCKDGQIRNIITKRCNKIKAAKAAKAKSPIKKVCPEGKVLNPKTNRCVKIKATKTEKKEEKDKSKSPIKKDCPEGKVLNPKTNRCVKIKVSKPKSHENKAAKIIQHNFKKFMYPFINRVSANINDRRNYYKMVIKNIDINTNKTDYCMRFYKMDKDNKPIYRLGSKIILKTQIGSQSANGIVFLSSFRDKNKKLFKYAIKMTKLSKSGNNDELTILNILTKAVLNNTCPHFPILYKYLVCDNFLNLNNSSFNATNSKSNSDNKKEVGKLKNYPPFIINNISSRFCFYINELANGDLKTFITDNYKNVQLLKNAFVQIYLSLMFFYKETNMYHNDSHWGNFLFHKIKAGGYFHYKILGIDYYLENMGYLWVIWDADSIIKLTSQSIDVDFSYIIKSFYSTKNNGYIKSNINKAYENLILQIKDDLFVSIKKNKQFNDFKYTSDKLNLFINHILSIFAKYNLIITSGINKTDKLINKTPYTIIPF